MPKTMRERKASCSRRKTAAGVPFKCFATKTEKCSQLSLLGKHPGECRRSHSAGIVSSTTVRRPVGDPIDLCTASHDDLAMMTVAQIKRFMLKHHVVVPKVNVLTGLPVVKADLIDAALGAAPTCPRGDLPINLETASTREVGLAMKYRGLEIPAHGDASICGRINPKATSQLRFNLIGKGKKSPCKRQFKTLLQQKLGQQIMKPDVLPPAFKGLFANVEPAKPTPLIQPLVVIQPAAAAAAAAATTFVPQKVETTPVAVAVPMAPVHHQQIAPVEKVKVEINVPKPVVAIELPPIVVAQPAEPIVAAAPMVVAAAPSPPIIIKKTYDPSNQSNMIEFKTIVPEGVRINQKLYGLMQIDEEHPTDFTIDQSCLLNFVPDQNITPVENIIAGGMLFRACLTSEGGFNDCSNRLLLNMVYIGTTVEDRSVQNWRNRTTRYQAVSEYQKSLNSLPMVLPYNKAWMCGKNDISFKYTFKNEQNKIVSVNSPKGLTGFVLVDIPEGYRYNTMTDFIVWSIKEQYDPSDDSSFGVMKLVRDLVARFRDTGYVPQHIIPQNVGFLISLSGPKHTVYAVIHPPLMNALDESRAFEWTGYEATYKDGRTVAGEKEYVEYINELSPP